MSSFSGSTLSGGIEVTPAHHFLVLMLLLAAVFAVYGRVLGHEFILNWDDNLYVTDNAAIRGFSLPHLKSAFTSFYVGNYAPLQIISYMFDYTLWGLRPAGYLLTNLILHGINGFLLYLLVARLSGRFPAAFGAALLFLVHPVQVESVAWVSQRKNLLSMSFFLLGALAYIMFRQDSGRRRSLYWVSVAVFAAALMTKSVAVVFPVMIVLYDLCYEKRSLARALPDKIPFAIIAAVAAVMALVSQSYEYGGGGRTAFHGGSAYATLLTMLPVFAGYLRMLLWPAGLSAAYAPAIKYAPDMEVIAATLLLILVVCSVGYLFCRDRQRFFWAALFPLALLPVAQLVPLITLMNDRYLYYPMIGAAPFVALSLSSLSQRHSLPVRRLVCLGAVVALTALAVTANQRAKVWQDAATLWRDAVDKAPDSPVARYSLAEVYVKAGRYAEARQLLLDLTAAFPDRVAPYELLANLCYETGDTNSAKEFYIKALALKPDLANANLGLGNIYLAEKNIELARMKFLAAARIKPDSPDIAYSLASTEAVSNRQEAALAYLNKAFLLGFRGCQAVNINPELDSLRGLPAFDTMVTEFCGERSSR